MNVDTIINGTLEEIVLFAVLQSRDDNKSRNLEIHGNANFVMAAVLTITHGISVSCHLNERCFTTLLAR